MSQHDFDITTADANTGLTMRAQINAALQALASNSSAATTPGTSYAFQLWADTTSGFMKIRNAANNAWIQLFPLAVAFSATALANAVALRDGSGNLAGSIDQLDGQHGSFYQNASNLNAGTIPQARLLASDILALLCTVDTNSSTLNAQYLMGLSPNNAANNLLVLDSGGKIPAANQGGSAQYTAGNYIIASAAAVGSLNTSPTKVKEFHMGIYGGSATAYYQLGNLADRSTYFRIYKNGSPHGLSRTLLSTQTGMIYSETITFAPGDLIQCYAWADAGADNAITLDYMYIKVAGPVMPGIFN